MPITTSSAAPAAVPRLPAQQSASGGRAWLHDHLVRDHGRALHEIAGLPLADVHRLEHVDQTMSLLQLGHRHPGDDEAAD